MRPAAGHLRHDRARSRSMRAFLRSRGGRTCLRLPVRESLVAGAGVFRVAASLADAEIERYAEILGFRFGGAFHLDDDGVVLALGERSLRYEHVALFLELQFHLAGGCLGGGGDDLNGGGLGFHGGIIKCDADGAILLNEELGLLVFDFKDTAFARPCFNSDFGEGAAGKGDE